MAKAVFQDSVIYKSRWWVGFGWAVYSRVILLKPDLICRNVWLDIWKSGGTWEWYSFCWTLHTLQNVCTSVTCPLNATSVPNKSVPMNFQAPPRGTAATQPLVYTVAGSGMGRDGCGVGMNIFHSANIHQCRLHCRQRAKHGPRSPRLTVKPHLHGIYIPGKRIQAQHESSWPAIQNTMVWVA